MLGRASARAATGARRWMRRWWGGAGIHADVAFDAGLSLSSARDGEREAS